jgi:hypothetical protein
MTCSIVRNISCDSLESQTLWWLTACEVFCEFDSQTAGEVFSDLPMTLEVQARLQSDQRIQPGLRVHLFSEAFHFGFCRRFVLPTGIVKAFR